MISHGYGLCFLLNIFTIRLYAISDKLQLYPSKLVVFRELNNHSIQVTMIFCNTLITGNQACMIVFVNGRIDFLFSFSKQRTIIQKLVKNIPVSSAVAIIEP